MDKEFRENVRNVFLKIVKKNKHLKEPMLFFLTVVLTGYYSLRHFKDNGKRYAGVGFVVLFFMLNSSFAFSFPMEDESASISDSTESIGKFDEASVMEDAEPVLINNQEAPVATEVIEETEEVDFYRMSEHHGLEDEDQYTLEDILEEIVGNILDEYDVDEEYIEATDNEDEYIIDGKTPLEELEERFDISFEEEEFETLNGFLISKLDHIPEEGEQFDIDVDGYNFRILSVESKMILRVLVTKIKEPEGEK